MSVTAVRDDADGHSRLRPFVPVMTIGEEGLVLGATVLAPMRRDACGMPALAVDGAEERILALLAIAYGKMIGPGISVTSAGPRGNGIAANPASRKSTSPIAGSRCWRTRKRPPA
jgi:hypothetical protein